jgi:hypothetical protein
MSRAARLFLRAGQGKSRIDGAVQTIGRDLGVLPDALFRAIIYLTTVRKNENEK